MKKIIRLTETELINVVKRVINEQSEVRGKIEGYCQMCDKINVGITTKARETANALRFAIDDEDIQIGRFFTSLNSFQEFCSLVKAFKKIVGVDLYEYLYDELGWGDEDIYSPIALSLANLKAKYKSNDKNYHKTNQTQWKPGGNYNW
jgi:hypothetical protein